MTIDTYDLTNPAKPTIIKDWWAVLDYPFDWTEWLDAIVDTITLKEIVITGAAPPMEEDSSTIDGTNKKVVVWLSAGVIGETYQVDCKITTASGRKDSRSIYVKIKDR